MTSSDSDICIPSSAGPAVEELVSAMAQATRMRQVGRLCLQAALNRIADDIAGICDVHAAAIANAPPAVAAELRRLKSAAAEGLEALKAGPLP